MEMKTTGWEITGASGVTVKVGTPIAQVEIGASYIRLPIQNLKTGKSIMLKGAGAGFAYGLGISTPVITASGSLDQFPAGGIGSIVQGHAAPSRPYQPKDFVGDLMVFSLGAGKEVSGSISAALWLKEPIEVCMLRLNCTKENLKVIAQKTAAMMLGIALPPAALALPVAELYSRTKAVGCFAGMNVETQLIGVGADFFGYKVSV